jgi:hypothetical protein
MKMNSMLDKTSTGRAKRDIFQISSRPVPCPSLFYTHAIKLNNILGFGDHRFPNPTPQPITHAQCQPPVLTLQQHGNITLETQPHLKILGGLTQWTDLSNHKRRAANR